MADDAARPDVARAVRTAAFTGLIAAACSAAIAFKAVQDIRNELVRRPAGRCSRRLCHRLLRTLIGLLPRARLKARLAEFSHRRSAHDGGCGVRIGDRLLGRAQAGFGSRPRSHAGDPLASRRSRLIVAARPGSGTAIRPPSNRSPAPTSDRRRLRSAALGFAAGLSADGAVLCRLTGATMARNFGILILTYVMLGWGLNIVVGLAGLLDLGYVAFYAVGAYSYALLANELRPVVLDLPAARRHPCGVLGRAARLSGAAAARRLSRHRHAGVRRDHPPRAAQLASLTGGPNGISGIPRPSFFGLPFDDGGGRLRGDLRPRYSPPSHRVVFLFYLILALALLTNWVTIRLRRLPIGRAWEAMREDEIACRSLGINTTTTKLTAFAIGAMFGGFAGSFFATRQGFISAGELHLQRIGPGAGHRRARRHGQPARRRRSPPSS